MALEVEMEDPPKLFQIVRAVPLVPLRVAEIRVMVHTDNKAREEEVRKNVKVGDICVMFKDNQTYSDRILHSPSGLLVASWYAEYLLFQYATDIKRIVIAKR